MQLFNALLQQACNKMHEKGTQFIIKGMQIFLRETWKYKIHSCWRPWTAAHVLYTWNISCISGHL